MKKIICLSLLLFGIGCANVKYREIGADGTTKEFSYSRVGKQELNGFSAKLGDKEFGLKGNKADAGILGEAVVNMSAAAADIAAVAKKGAMIP